MILASRLQTDLRGVALEASLGYALQAMTIASAVREIAVALMYIGADDGRARDWAQHDKEWCTYPAKHKPALKEVLPRYLPEADDAAVEREYDVYTYLCWAKHANPMLQRGYGITETAPDAAHLERQPNASPDTLWCCRYAIAQAVRAALWAVGVFAQCHLPGEAAVAMIERTAFVMNATHTFNGTRWPDYARTAGRCERGGLTVRTVDKRGGPAL